MKKTRSNPVPKILSKKERFKGRIFTISELRVRLPNGKEMDFEVAGRKNEFTSFIVPVDDKGRVLMVEEWHAAIGKRELIFPKGRVEKGESPLEGAKRELVEECGVKARKMREIATFTVHPGYTAFRTKVFLATGLEKAQAKGDEWEKLPVKRIKLEKAIEMALEGKITEARTIAALFLARKIMDKSW
jgi:ADP-ribose diphosphatase